ncbi:MAG TPA: hypothetical protein VMU84_16000 [Thermoanaerobaculia bacterium]|nr:hypothetical protein [Thermoanaerobaculia bacterium]
MSHKVTVDPDDIPNRQTCFEIHIRPMMRLIDHDHMLYLAPAGSTIDLFDYDDVKKHADAILERLMYNMPTVRYGGTWPAEWILLFERWQKEEYPRLENYQGKYSVAIDDNDMVVLTGTFQTIRKRDRIWFERFSTSDSPREYHAFREPGSGDPNVTTVEIQERFPRVSGTVIVFDPEKHELAIP